MVQTLVEGVGHRVMKGLGYRDEEASVMTLLTSYHDNSRRMDDDVIAEIECMEVLQHCMVASSFPLFGLLPSFHQFHESCVNAILLLDVLPSVELQERNC